MSKLMPILKPAGYRKDVPYFFKESLIENEGSPVIAFGNDKGSHIEYEGCETEDDFTDRFTPFKEEAMQNLKEVFPSVEIQELEGSKIAFITGHEYASEKILDVNYMKELGEKMGDQSLMVGIPFKGHLLATGSSSNVRAKFPVVIQNYFENPQQDAISPYVFLVESGQVIGMGGQNLPDENESFVISENLKSSNFTVTVNCSTIDELKDIVNNTYQQILLSVMKNTTFGGEIRYEIKPTLPFSDELVNRCQSFVDQIKDNELAQTIVAAIAKNGINPVFVYDGRQIAPQIGDETSEEIEDKEELTTTDANASLEKDYSAMSVQQLDNVFYEIASVPNARLHVPSLEKMVVLMAEYEKRNIKVPSERPSSSRRASRPKSNPNTKSKPWWKFW
ncbi:hypothetical protein [Portibacter lacus]|uniref:Uncharacterized protein n=1 Tax=Portibacter lacus TaxID=1099794 RepID=A0AA37SVN1_9BACT|nr:hypothetical protein [Portibacter lacus]GLR18933.1 hypothetical protein GCM10007940_35490 [Portibacter lacus]